MIIQLELRRAEREVTYWACCVRAQRALAPALARTCRGRLVSFARHLGTNNGFAVGPLAAEGIAADGFFSIELPASC